MLTSLLVLVCQRQQHAPRYIFKQNGSFISAAADYIASQAMGTNVQVSFTEKIPSDAQADLDLEADDIPTFIEQLTAKTAVRFAELDKAGVKHYFLCWSGATPPECLRFYQQNGVYVLETGSAKLQDISDILKSEANYRVAASYFTQSGYTLDETVKGFTSGKSLQAGKLPDNEKPEDFAKRFLREYHAFTMQPAPAPSPTIRGTWNLTFLPTSPSNIGSDAAQDFASGSPYTAIGTLATQLNAAFTGDGKKPDAQVFQIGNSMLQIAGSQDNVDNVRRLLATQIDIPQSQIRVRLDTYVMSADIKSLDDGRRSLDEISLGQEIARAYKFGYMNAIKGVLMSDPMNCSIKQAMDKMSSKEVVVANLFDKIGIYHSSKRALGLTDILMFLAFADNQQLQTLLPAAIKSQFDEIHTGITDTVINPMLASSSPIEVEMAKNLSVLNDNLGLKVPLEIATGGDSKGHHNDIDKKIYSPVTQIAIGGTDREMNHKEKDLTKVPLGDNRIMYFTRQSFANTVDGGLEDYSTRKAIVDFMLLWLGTSNPNLHSAAATKSPVAVGKSLLEVNVSNKASQPTGQDAITGQYVTDLLSGDVPADLARSSSHLDDLLSEGVESLTADARVLIDEPLRRWIDGSILPKRPVGSRFGVSSGGNTELLMTSRVPGRSVTNTDSFFPYQPVAPISPDSLIPLLSRTSQNHAATGSQVTPSTSTSADTSSTPSSTAAQLAAAGMTPLEIVAFQGIFDQASKPPYDRKLGTGISISLMPTVLPNANTVRMQIKLHYAVTPDDNTNGGGTRKGDVPGPIDLIKDTTVETEVLANAFDTTKVSSLKLDVTAPAKRDWEVPVLSQILPIRSWFVGPTQDKTVRHEALVILTVTVFPRSMDIASRYLDGVGG